MLIAVLGIILPIFIAVGVVMAFGGTFIQSFSTGAAIAPTSLGVVAKLLKEVGELDTPLGQIISMAAVFDDVLSLILLSFIEKLADESATTWQMVSPVVFAFVFIVGALLMSTMVPKVVTPAMEKIKSDTWKQYFSLFCLLVFALPLTFLANVAGTSFLLGGYLAGIAFASVGEVIPTVYEGQVKRLMLWTCRLFFAASIAFEIPVKGMFNADSLLLGLCLAIIAVFGKMLCGIGTFPNLKRDGPAVGVAMLGRGEFGFLIASKASSLGLVNKSQYASAVWGVVVPTILTPILFAPVFRMRQKLVGTSEEPDENSEPMVKKNSNERGNVDDTNVAREEHS
jgi:Kef-type K+ transport system membrane component KefB